MKMSNLEKKFVNSKRHARGNYRVIDALLARVDLDRGCRALEIGCGAGAVAAHLADEYGMTVVGTDVDPEQVLEAKKRHTGNGKTTFVEADATGLPFEDAGFDLVVSQNVLHHIPDWDKALTEISRILKPGGTCLFDDFALPGTAVRLLNLVAYRYGWYSIEDIEGVLETGGLEVVHREKPRGFLFKQYNLAFRKSGTAGTPAGNT